MNTLSDKKITQLLTKYAVILILFEILSRFGLNLGLIYFYKLFSVEEIMMNPPHFDLAVTSISMIMNLLIAIILLFEMNKRTGLCWVIFVMGLFAPWIAVLFMILWKFVEAKSTAQA